MEEFISSLSEIYTSIKSPMKDIELLRMIIVEYGESNRANISEKTSKITTEKIVSELKKQKSSKIERVF